MKCKWCNGTSKECGCGLGYCSHCDKGQTADWPFGLTNESLTEDCHLQFDKVWRWNDLHATLSFIAEEEKISFSAEDEAILEAFFNHDYRNTNVGTFCAIAVARAKQLAK